MLIKSLNQLLNSSNKLSHPIVNNTNEFNFSFELNSIQGTNKYYNSIFTRPQMYNF